MLFLLLGEELCQLVHGVRLAEAMSARDGEPAIVGKESHVVVDEALGRKSGKRQRVHIVHVVFEHNADGALVADQVAERQQLGRVALCKLCHCRLAAGLQQLTTHVAHVVLVDRDRGAA